MSKRTKRKGISLVLQLWMPVLIVAVALFFFTALSNMGTGQSEEAKA